MQSSLALIVFGVVNVPLALVLYFNNPKSWTNRLFSALIIFLTLYLIVNSQIYVGHSYEVRLLFARFIMFCGSFINLLVFLFLATFPEKNIPFKRRITLPLVFLTIILSLIASFTGFIFEDIKINGNIVTPVVGKLMPVFMLHTVILVLGGMIAIIRKYRKSEGLDKIRLRYVFFAFAILFFLIIIFNFLLPVLLNIGVFVPFLPLYILIFLIIVSYAILRHRLLDIRALVAKTVSYSFLLFVIVAGYVFGSFAITDFLPEGVSRTFVYTGLTIVAIFTFNPLRRLFEELTDKFFFKGRYDSGELLSELTHIMAEEIDIKLLSGRLLSTLNSQMRLVNTAFIVIDKNGNRVQVEKDHGGENLYLSDEDLQKLGELGEILIFEELNEDEAKVILRKHEISIFVPLRTKEELVGYLLLGPKASGDVYSSEDIEVLEIFGKGAAIALQNSLAYLEIQEFSRTLEKKVEQRTKELKEAQTRELAKAKELLRLKDEFVFIASHDLKAPVTAIKGFVELIKDAKDKLSRDTWESFEAIQEASERLNQLVNDLLQVARSESGTIKVITSPIDVNEVILAAVKQTELLASQGKVKVTTNLDFETKVVLADKPKLSEIVENLLSNAVKYNREGGKVTISTQKKDRVLQVSVADTGFGIPKDQQVKVFEKFFRARQKGTEEVQGTGLGLFVVRMLVEKMGGKIGFFSEEGKGTTFTFTLALANKS